jgi:hypothetical protein
MRIPSSRGRTPPRSGPRPARAISMVPWLGMPSAEPPRPSRLAAWLGIRLQGNRTQLDRSRTPAAADHAGGAVLMGCATRLALRQVTRPVGARAPKVPRVDRLRQAGDSVRPQRHLSGGGSWVSLSAPRRHKARSAGSPATTRGPACAAVAGCMRWRPRASRPSARQRAAHRPSRAIAAGVARLRPAREFALPLPSASRSPARATRHSHGRAN